MDRIDFLIVGFLVLQTLFNIGVVLLFIVSWKEDRGFKKRVVEILEHLKEL